MQPNLAMDKAQPLAEETKRTKLQKELGLVWTLE